MVRFILNNSTVEASEEAGSTVLDFIRYRQRLTGTKIGCREGDCGACTVLAGGFENGKLVYRSVTSCLMPLANAAGKHIVTVEGINMDKLSPVQEAMVNNNGSQCGFCTLGFVMSLTGFVINERSYEKAIQSIDGNICRCTGYKSIERAAAAIADRMNDKPADNEMQWLVDQKFLPGYFKNIEQRLTEIQDRIYEENEEPLTIGGGTDLLVQKALTVKRSLLKTVLTEREFKKIEQRKDKIIIGGAVTVSEFAESADIKNLFPDLDNIIRLVSSTPIRNMATMAGNFVNASPIGDMSIFFLALNADVEIGSGSSTRMISLKEFFKAYKQTALEKGELIRSVSFETKNTSLFNFEKVSKRTHLDIASVNSACSVTKGEENKISEIHLSAGGVAPFPKYLRETCSYLTGRQVNADVLKEAVRIMNDEIAPISDARGDAEYKRLLLRQLFIAHMLKFFGQQPVKQFLLQ